jgi:hypothetical protein
VAVKPRPTREGKGNTTVSQISTDDNGLDPNAAPIGNMSVNGSSPHKPQRWRDMSDRQKRIVVGALIVHMIVASLTLRDLRRRPPEAVRGPKALWRTWVTLNTTGSVAYWLFGRRGAD